MNRDKRQLAGLAGTIIIHLLIAAMLYLVYVQQPKNQEEGGVPVMMGNADMSKGMFDPASMTEVDILPNPAQSDPEPQENAEEPPMLTQEEEQTVSIPEKKKKPKETQQPKANQQVKQKSEAEKRAELEKQAAERAAKNIAGAFGKGAKMSSKGTGSKENYLEGYKNGNTSSGQTHGAGGYGTFDLNGRSLGEGGLPKPVYNVQDEGRVVITITVDSSGKVISTSINKRTNTVNATLRRAAEDAAKRARFNAVEGVNNQTGTITYYFKLK